MTTIFHHKSTLSKIQLLGRQKSSRKDCSGLTFEMQDLLGQMRSPVHNQMTFWQDDAGDFFLTGWRSVKYIYFFHFQRVNLP